MTIINTSPDRIIQLGYEGEDRVTVLRFRYSADWLENGEGIFHIRVRRHGEHTAYNAQLVADDAENLCLLMTVTNTELSVKGSGEMQVVYSGEDFVKKSPIYSYNVSRAVDEVADPPAQDVYTQIIESLSGLHDTVWDIDRAVAETDARVGNLSELTTTAKTDLVSAINEVNEHGGGSATVDDALSTTSTNPVQNKVVTSAIRGKADTQTVSALSDAVNGLNSDVQGLQTTKAGKSYVDNQLSTKASTAVATQSANGLMSSADKIKLDELSDSGVSDVFELIRCITLEEDMVQVTIDADNSSSSFEITDFIVFIWSVGASGATSEASVKVALNSASLDTNRCCEIASLIRKEGINTSRSGYVFGINAKKLCYFAFSSGTIDRQIIDGSGNISEFGNSSINNKSQGFVGVSTVNAVTIGTTSSGKLGTGSIIALYGVRA